MDSSLCAQCKAPPQPPWKVQLRYPPTESEPLIGESETPGSILRMSPVDEPCFIRQVSKGLLSSDVHQPDSPPRVTQTSIGKFLVSDPTPRDSAVGVAGVNGEGENEAAATQRHGSGDEDRRGKSRVADRVLDNWTNQEKAWWVDKPGKNAEFVHCIQKEFTQRQPFDPYASHRSKFMLFPRSKDYELSSIIARREDCQDETGVTGQLLCNCGPSNTCCPDKYCQKQLARCQTPYWLHDVPYWWYGDGERTHLPVGSPDDYSYIRMRDEELKGHEPFNLINTLLLDRAERYIPGQIYCEQRRKIQGIGQYKYDKCHPPPPPLTAEQMSDKAMAEERETCLDRPYSNAKRGPTIHDETATSVEGNTAGTSLPCRVCTEILRKRLQYCDLLEAQREDKLKHDLLRVGQPFRSAACKLHHQLYPPQKSTTIPRTSMKCFPHTRLTNL